MRAALALLLALPPAGAVAVPPRVATLDLCADELALMLAAPGQLVSVSRLGADPRETTLAARARGLPVNRGRVTDVAALAPELVLAVGGDPAGRAAAARLGMRVLTLPWPATLAEVRANTRAAASAIGRAAAGEAAVAAMDAALGPPPATVRPALLVGGGGVTPAADGLAAAWLRRAGLAQQAVPKGQLALERLLASPPDVLVTSRYHAGETSRHQAWLAHPAFIRLPATVRRATTDGRPWTCMGPPLAAEVARLRRSVPPLLAGKGDASSGTGR